MEAREFEKGDVCSVPRTGLKCLRAPFRFFKDSQESGERPDGESEASLLGLLDLSALARPWLGKSVLIQIDFSGGLEMYIGVFKPSRLKRI